MTSDWFAAAAAGCRHDSHRHTVHGVWLPVVVAGALFSSQPCRVDVSAESVHDVSEEEDEGADGKRFNVIDQRTAFYTSAAKSLSEKRSSIQESASAGKGIQTIPASNLVVVVGPLDMSRLAMFPGVGGGAFHQPSATHSPAEHSLQVRSVAGLSIGLLQTPRARFRPATPFAT